MRKRRTLTLPSPLSSRERVQTALKRHGKRFQAAEQEARLAADRAVNQLKTGEPLENGAEGKLTLQAPQGRSDAVMASVAEGDVLVARSGNVEPVGVGELLRVAVGRRQRDEDHLPGVNRLAAQRNRLDR